VSPLWKAYSRRKDKKMNVKDLSDNKLMMYALLEILDIVRNPAARSKDISNITEELNRRVFMPDYSGDYPIN
jgi:hypothetical protein